MTLADPASTVAAILERRIDECGRHLRRLHEHLHAIQRKTPGAFAPYGDRDRDADFGPDCSCGCGWFLSLEGIPGISLDWGVCCNPDSERAGLLTWEHAGCRRYAHYDYLRHKSKPLSASVLVMLRRRARG